MRLFFATTALLSASIGLTNLVSPALAQVAVVSATDSQPGYSDLADLVLKSPLVVDATIRSATKIKGAEAAGVAPGHTRFYVEADVTSLVRGADAIPARVGWLVDTAPDWRGKPPSLKKRRVLAFARTVPGQPGQLQLVELDAQRDWSATLEQRVRGIAREIAAPDAPPVITGVRNAFHVPGALPGEGETQIFLHTRDNRPAALSVLRRPGEQPRWSLALSEIIDDSAVVPTRDTLLWYRLACALPGALPDSATGAMTPEDADQARIDYGFVIQQLGPCRGTPPAAPSPGAAAAPVSGGGEPG